MAPGADMEVGQLVGAAKTRGIHVESANFTETLISAYFAI